MTDCAGRQGPPKVNYNVVTVAVFVFVFISPDGCWWSCVEFRTAADTRVGYRRQRQHLLQPSALQSSAFFKESVT
ncbi:hypothetical protein RP20_CCG013713 [Aedes albopictus]|nr:hypothetical protein RP20_CCG013713 [Aedes albopictus]